jgi:hypoxanthine phosphoribosyltransferase
VPAVREIISAERIAQRVSELGRDIDRLLPPGPLAVVGVLRGAFVFMADLVRAIPRDMTCDFLGVRSYGDATVSSGVVEITSDLSAPIAGAHVLLIEDIVDSGLTLRYLLELLRARGPASLHTCVLLSKPVGTPAGGPPPVDFVGFDAPDAFVVGYGLDGAQRYRNLPYIGILDGLEA